MEVKINYKDRNLVMNLESGDKTVWDLKKQISQAVRVPQLQQQISYLDNGVKRVLSDDKMPLKLAGIPEGTVVKVKNLGSQLRWRFVFFIQYFGPMVIFPALYFLGKRQEYNQIQHIAVAMGFLHYFKRELQTAFVHVFSRTSMPASQCVKNCSHYWILFGLLNGIEIFFFPNGHTYKQGVLIAIVAAWTLFEFCNLQCHIVLSSFRKGKAKKEEYENMEKRRGIPRGWGFDLVSCANYFWEVMAWCAFSVLTRGYTSIGFTIISAVQMLVWAIKKHKAYRKQFGEAYPKGRKAMFPFII